MPAGLKRYYGRGDLHFVTFSCYRRLDLLRSQRARTLFVQELARVRRERVAEATRPKSEKRQKQVPRVPRDDTCSGISGCGAPNSDANQEIGVPGVRVGAGPGGRRGVGACG